MLKFVTWRRHIIKKIIFRHPNNIYNLEDRKAKMIIGRNSILSFHEICNALEMDKGSFHARPRCATMRYHLTRCPDSEAKDEEEERQVCCEDSWRERRMGPIAEEASIVGRLAVIRQANHPRACYLNGRRYAVTSQLPLSTRQFNCSDRSMHRRSPWNIGPLSMGLRQWPRPKLYGKRTRVKSDPNFLRELRLPSRDELIEAREDSPLFFFSLIVVSMMCATKEEINLAFDMVGIDGVEGISWKEM